MLLIEKKSEVLNLTLNRPESKNALTSELISLITEQIDLANTDHQVRVIVIKGTGTAFCAGADLKTMKSMIHFTLDQNKEDAEHLFRMFKTMQKCTKPIITLLHGAVYGGALGFLAVSDVTLSNAKTQFCFSEVKLGITPAIISHFLIKKFPLSSLSPLMTSGKVFSSETALKLGFINEISEDMEFKGLDSWISAYKDAGPEAIATTKNLLSQVSVLNETESHNFVIDTLAKRRVSAEGQEGLKSFFEKREPNWRKK